MYPSMPRLDGSFSGSLSLPEAPDAPDAAETGEPSAPAMPTISPVTSTLEPMHVHSPDSQEGDAVTPLAALVLAGKCQ
jgi:hypothetical protein